MITVVLWVGAFAVPAAVSMLLPPMGNVVLSLSPTHGIHLGDLLIADLSIVLAAVGTAVVWSWDWITDAEKHPSD